MKLVFLSENLNILHVYTNVTDFTHSSLYFFFWFRLVLLWIGFFVDAWAHFWYLRPKIVLTKNSSGYFDKSPSDVFTHFTSIVHSSLAKLFLPWLPSLQAIATWRLKIARIFRWPIVHWSLNMSEWNGNLLFCMLIPQKQYWKYVGSLKLCNGCCFCRFFFFLLLVHSLNFIQYLIDSKFVCSNFCNGNIIIDTTGNVYWGFAYEFSPLIWRSKYDQNRRFICIG